MKVNVLFSDSLFAMGNLLFQIVRFVQEEEYACITPGAHAPDNTYFVFFSYLGWQLYAEHYERDFLSIFLTHTQHTGKNNNWSVVCRTCS